MIFFRALLPDLAQDLVRKAIDPLFPRGSRNDEPFESDSSESKTQDTTKGHFVII